MIISPVIWGRLFLAVLLIGWRCLIESSEFVYMAEVMGYFLINIVLTKYINKNIKRSEEVVRKFKERVTK